MKVMIFGATGMVGQGVLRECLLDPAVDQVLAVGRTATGQQHAKLAELVQSNLLDYSGVESRLTGFDACFFCLGVSSVGMSEQRYMQITYDLTMAAAQTLARLNPDMTFIYVSGASTDSTEQGRSMWARVKGRTENALLRLPFKAYMFRPGFIQPQHGIKSKTPLYRIIYAATGFLAPALIRMAPGMATTNEQIGRAMLKVAKSGWPTRILEGRAINEA